MKIKKLSWQQEIRDRVKYLENENFRLCQELALSQQKVKFLSHFTDGPPTLMIACEKVVEAAAQIATSATTILREGRR